MTKIRIKSNQKYRFCGNGDGVAGLPHEIDAETAYQMGLSAVLQAAIKLGYYQEILPEEKPDETKESEFPEEPEAKGE